jgi:hypothetical protein
MSRTEGSIFQSSGIPKAQSNGTRQTLGLTFPWLRGFRSARSQVRQEFPASRSAALTLEPIQRSDAAEDFETSPAEGPASAGPPDMQPRETNREHFGPETIAYRKEPETSSVRTAVSSKGEPGMESRTEEIGISGGPGAPGPGNFDPPKGGSHRGKLDMGSGTKAALPRPDVERTSISKAPGPGISDPFQRQNDDKGNDANLPASRSPAAIRMVVAGDRPVFGERAASAGAIQPASPSYKESMGLNSALPRGFPVRRKPETTQPTPARYHSSSLPAAPQAVNQLLVEGTENIPEAEPSLPESSFVISSMSRRREAPPVQTINSRRPERVVALEMLQRERPRDTAPIRHVHIGTLHVTVKAPATTPMQQAPQPQLTPMPRRLQEQAAIRHDPWDSYRSNFD